MRSWVLVAGLLAAAAAPPALAADIDDGPPPPKSGLYDDPRFLPKAPPQYYEDDDDRPYGPLPPNKYSGVPPPLYGRTCIRSEQVREQLTNLGWQDFHAGQPVSETAVTLRARRPNGRLFELTLQRCSGQIVDARPLEPRPYGPYAFARPHSPYAFRERYEEPYRQRRWGPYGYDSPRFERRPYADRGPQRWFRD